MRAPPGRRAQPCSWYADTLRPSAPRRDCELASATSGARQNVLRSPTDSYSSTSIRQFFFDPNRLSELSQTSQPPPNFSAAASRVDKLLQQQPIYRNAVDPSQTPSLDFPTSYPLSFGFEERRFENASNVSSKVSEPSNAIDGIFRKDTKQSLHLDSIPSLVRT